MKSTRKPKRPVSPASLAANRANAAQSTGPRTPEGKAVSARNALRHGFATSSFGVVRLEDLQEVGRLQADLVAAYQPANSQELFALERMAVTQQTIRRAARLESGLFTTCLNETLDANDYPAFPMNQATLRRWRNGNHPRSEPQLLTRRRLPPPRPPVQRLVPLPPLPGPGRAPLPPRPRGIRPPKGPPPRITERTHSRPRTRSKHRPLHPIRLEPVSTPKHRPFTPTADPGHAPVPSPAPAPTLTRPLRRAPPPFPCGSRPPPASTDASPLAGTPPTRNLRRPASPRFADHSRPGFHSGFASAACP